MTSAIGEYGHPGNDWGARLFCATEKPCHDLIPSAKKP